ncbi:MAG: hypothetical protein M9958_11270 [Chitinophagales bacterium]|nr:hypothetical protein [Chitinophagales bacterium]
MVSLFQAGVLAGMDTLIVARENTRIIHEILNDPLADHDIAVDVKGIIYLAPYEDINHVVHSVLDGGNPGTNTNRAIRCLTFDYGSSFATQQDSDTISIRNFQVEASDKAFLFESSNEATRVNVTDLYNSQVSVCWFGAVADCANTLSSIAVATDNLVSFLSAINSFRNNSSGNFAWRQIVRIPAGIGNQNMYYFSDQLVIQSNVSLIGDGDRRTQLFFPKDTGGILVSQAIVSESITSGNNSSIEDLRLFGPLFVNSNPVPLPTYNKSNGITIKGTCYVSRVIVDAFDGNGIHVSANVTAAHPSNANYTQLNLVTCSNNSVNGVLIDTADKGKGDTNACMITSANVVRNGACGIRDQSFLGNTYIGCHSATNSAVNNNRSRVFHNGIRYICIQDNNGVEPGVDEGWENYWIERGTSSVSTSIYKQWLVANKYVMSYGYALFGANGGSSGFLSGSYSEDDELSVFNGQYHKNSHKKEHLSSNLIIGGVASKTSDYTSRGIIRNHNGVIETQAFRIISRPLQEPGSPYYEIHSPNVSDAFRNNKGGFTIAVHIIDKDEIAQQRIMNFMYEPTLRAFVFRQKNSPTGDAFMFSPKESLDYNKTMFGNRESYKGSLYPVFNQIFFMKYIDRTYKRLFSFTDKHPEEANVSIDYVSGDIFLRSRPDTIGPKYRNPLGYRCVASPSVNFPKGEWETLHYFQPAVAVPDTASPIGATYSQAEVQGILDELRDLKTKMRAAGILLT